jgi:addiction module HigA family antidote
MHIKNPPHPGDFIRTEIIESAGLTVTAAAKALRVSRPTLSSLLNGKADLSGGIALRIEEAFGGKMDTLVRMQSSYDIAQTRKREKQIRVPRISFPCKRLVVPGPVPGRSGAGSGPKPCQDGSTLARWIAVCLWSSESK